MATYFVKELFYTLQGEGAYTGRASVFLRFTGCNLWSGREEDRLQSICKFCDTDFVGTNGVGGGKFESERDLVAAVSSLWPKTRLNEKWVVCTGGEPGLQLTPELITEFHEQQFKVAVETNGTQSLPQNIDWITVSPKGKSEIILRQGNELKLVVPQIELHPSQFEQWDFDHFFIQPKDDENKSSNTQWAVDFCKSNPKWRLSLQTHKLAGFP